MIEVLVDTKTWLFALFFMPLSCVSTSLSNKLEIVIVSSFGFDFDKLHTKLVTVSEKALGLSILLCTSDLSPRIT